MYDWLVRRIRDNLDLQLAPEEAGAEGTERVLWY